MTFKPAKLLIALLAVVAVPAFAQNVAVVNGKPIPSSRVDAVVKQVVAQGQQPDSPQLREMIKKDLIGREVLMQEAETKVSVKMQPSSSRSRTHVRPSSSTPWSATT
jgi:peptidyl-prolyl cis-trans isomerase C